MQRHPRRVRGFAGALAAVAGFTDAVGFLSLGGFFVSFMSGNSTRLGSALALGSREAAVAGVLIVAFVGGVALGTRVQGTRWQRGGAVGVAMLLLLAGLLHHLSMLASMACAAMAMGGLNTWAVAGAPLPVGLTYMTGTLVKIGQCLGRAGGARDVVPYLLHWIALVAGAVLGTWAFVAWAQGAMFVAAAWVLLLALVADRLQRAPHVAGA